MPRIFPITPAGRMVPRDLAGRLYPREDAAPVLENPLPAPTGLRVTLNTANGPTSGTAELGFAWDPVPGAARYETSLNGGPWGSTTATDGTTYPTHGQSMAIAVRAVSSTGMAGSPSQLTVTAAAPMAAPYMDVINYDFWIPETQRYQYVVNYNPYSVQAGDLFEVLEQGTDRLLASWTVVTANTGETVYVQLPPASRAVNAYTRVTRGASSVTGAAQSIPPYGRNVPNAPDSCTLTATMRADGHTADLAWDQLPSTWIYPDPGYTFTGWILRFQGYSHFTGISNVASGSIALDVNAYGGIPYGAIAFEVVPLYTRDSDGAQIPSTAIASSNSVEYKEPAPPATLTAAEDPAGTVTVSWANIDTAKLVAGAPAATLTLSNLSGRSDLVANGLPLTSSGSKTFTNAAAGNVQFAIYLANGYGIGVNGQPEVMADTLAIAGPPSANPLPAAPTNPMAHIDTFDPVTGAGSLVASVNHDGANLQDFVIEVRRVADDVKIGGTTLTAFMGGTNYGQGLFVSGSIPFNLQGPAQQVYVRFIPRNPQAEPGPYADGGYYDPTIGTPQQGQGVGKTTNYTAARDLAITGYNGGNPPTSGTQGFQLMTNAGLTDTPYYTVRWVYSADMAPFGSTQFFNVDKKTGAGWPAGQRLTINPPAGLEFLGSLSFTVDDYRTPRGGVDTLRFGDNHNPGTPTITASNTAPTVGQAVNFQASGSDPDGDPLSYTWDFGDGSALVTATTPSHTYATAGSYTVILTARDGRGGQASTALAISVQEINLAAPVPVLTSQGADGMGPYLYFTWDSVPEATSYEFSTDGQYFTNIGMSVGMSIRGEQNTPVTFYLRAVNAYGVGPVGQASGTFPANAQIPSVSGVSGYDYGGGNYNASWQAGMAGTYSMELVSTFGYGSYGYQSFYVYEGYQSYSANASGAPSGDYYVRVTGPDGYSDQSMSFWFTGGAMDPGGGDRDGDAVPDYSDMFPDDPTRW